jgi:hypothetical protein
MYNQNFKESFEKFFDLFKDEMKNQNRQFSGNPQDLFQGLSDEKILTPVVKVYLERVDEISKQSAQSNVAFRNMLMGRDSEGRFMGH